MPITASLFWGVITCSSAFNNKYKHDYTIYIQHTNTINKKLLLLGIIYVNKNLLIMYVHTMLTLLCQLLVIWRC